MKDDAQDPRAQPATRPDTGAPVSVNERARHGESEAGSGTSSTIDRYLRTAFLSRIAHDIRSPIGITAGALHELEGALGPQADEHRVWLTMMQRGVKRVLRLADRLSMAAELHERPLELARVRVDAGALVVQAVEAARFVQSRSAVTVDVEAAEGQHFAQIDARWMEPALVDVLTNAIRFAYRRVHVALRAEGARLVLTVDDDGAGVAPEAVAALFVPFAPRAGGAGLSLPIAHAVVAGHGGRFALEPSALPPGRGSTRGARVIVELDASP